MALTSLKLAGTALIAAAMLAPTAAGAQYYRAPTNFHEVRYAGDGYARGREGYERHRGAYDRERREQRRQRRSDYRDERCRHGNSGTLLGAIAGGLLGNVAVGRRGNRTVGTLAGAGAGALVGDAVDRDC